MWSGRWESRRRSQKFGTVVVMGGGVGTAMAYPTAAALKRAGNRVISIVGARNKELVILERELREVSDALMITTDDGSYADKGFVTDKLRQLIENGTRIDLVLAIGPDPHDESGGGDDAQRAHPHHRQPEPDHDRRHRHVRRLPRAGRRKERVRLRRRPRVRRAPRGFRRAGAAQFDVPRRPSRQSMEEFQLRDGSRIAKLEAAPDAAHAQCEGGSR